MSSPTPDQVNTALIGIASLSIAGISFIYASKAQRATREAETMRSRVSEVTVDAAAYARARDLYESSIKTFAAQNDSLRAEITELQHAKTALGQHNQELERRTIYLERALRAAGIMIPQEIPAEES